jgi:hypothetical protein
MLSRLGCGLESSAGEALHGRGLRLLVTAACWVVLFASCFESLGDETSRRQSLLLTRMLSGFATARIAQDRYGYYARRWL